MTDDEIVRVNLRFLLNPGDYEKRGDNHYSGRCAKCGDGVLETEPSVVLYSTGGDRGGIFHLDHQPTGPQWFGVGEEAPDV